LSYKIIADSACDLGLPYAASFGVDIVPFTVSYDGVAYKKEPYEETVIDFYKTLRETGAFAKTSLPSIAEYEKAMRKHFADGFDVLCVCLSSKLSGSYGAAVNAADLLTEEFPERQALVVDTLSASSGEGLFAIQAAKMLKRGVTLSDAANYLNKIKNEGCIYFTVDSLDYLQKGGRLGKVSALIGQFLDIKPLIALFGSGGELVPCGKIRGRKKALSEIVNVSLKSLTHDKSQYDCCIFHADCIDDALFVKKTLEEQGVIIVHPILKVGPTIGAHTGPTACAICLLRRYEELGSKD
jgi:DegV family protein with EDD domain